MLRLRLFLIIRIPDITEHCKNIMGHYGTLQKPSITKAVVPAHVALISLYGDLRLCHHDEKSNCQIGDHIGKNISRERGGKPQTAQIQRDAEDPLKYGVVQFEICGEIYCRKQKKHDHCHQVVRSR